jgi:hypothetical protein
MDWKGGTRNGATEPWVETPVLQKKKENGYNEKSEKKNILSLSLSLSLSLCVCVCVCVCWFSLILPMTYIPYPSPGMLVFLGVQATSIEKAKLEKRH